MTGSRLAALLDRVEAAARGRCGVSTKQHWAIRLRLRLLIRRDSRWNAWVRDITARLERAV